MLLDHYDQNRHPTREEIVVQEVLVEILNVCKEEKVRITKKNHKKNGLPIGSDATGGFTTVVSAFCTGFSEGISSFGRDESFKGK